MYYNEHIYKAKPIDSNMWVYGYYVYHQNRTPSPLGDYLYKEDEEYYIFIDEFSDWNMPRNLLNIKIDPSTLCRSLGIEDSKGNTIFENDIFEDCNKNKFVIFYDIENTRFIGKGIGANENKDRISYIGKEPRVTVVGNIFDA